jgi:hypothetical protein
LPGETGDTLHRIESFLDALPQPYIVNEGQDKSVLQRLSSSHNAFLVWFWRPYELSMRTMFACVTSFCAIEAMMRWTFGHSLQIKSS